MLDEGPILGRRGNGWDAWPLLLFFLHVAQVLAFSNLYPEHRFDPDILSYFVYFRSFVGHDSALHGAAFFNQPKPLLVFGLGPLGDVTWAFYCSTVAAGVIGSLAAAHRLPASRTMARASPSSWRAESFSCSRRYTCTWYRDTRGRRCQPA